MNSAQLESQSELKREGVEDTLNELRRRLTPGEILDETLAYAKDGGGEFLSNLGRQVADNPLPVTLIGAGLALYLFSNGKGTGSNQASVSYTDQPASRGASGGMAADVATAAREMGSNVVDKMGTYSSRIGDQLGEGYDAAANGLSDAAKSVGNAASSATDTVATAARKTAEIAGSARQTATETTRNTVAFLQDQPLIMVGVGIALGAAIGAAIPGTDLEDELMGETSDELKDKAKNVASEHLDKAREAGARLLDEVTEQAKTEVGALVDNLEDRPPDVEGSGGQSTVGDTSNQQGNGHSSSH
jgi:ElaB/YqjD/DUF883 family membrane-anchored ribosome-binding protein